MSAFRYARSSTRDVPSSPLPSPHLLALVSRLLLPLACPPNSDRPRYFSHPSARGRPQSIYTTGDTLLGSRLSHSPVFAPRAHVSKRKPVSPRRSASYLTSANEYYVSHDMRWFRLAVTARRALFPFQGTRVSGKGWGYYILGFSIVLLGACYTYWFDCVARQARRRAARNGSMGWLAAESLCFS
jgi:hypothetical protein